jgi:hypothetical protein
MADLFNGICYDDDVERGRDLKPRPGQIIVPRKGIQTCWNGWRTAQNALPRILQNEANGGLRRTKPMPVVGPR